MLDLDFVRRHFPALGEGWALFDNAGGSVPLRGVIDTVAEFMGRWPVQHGATYGLSAEAAARVRAGHDAMAGLIGAAPGEVVLGPSTSLNLRILAASLRPLWRDGDEVIVTDLDHEANIDAWRRLAETGIVVRTWPVRRETATLELEDLDALLTERTRLVAVTHCSNIVGEIVDVAEIARRAHAAGALVCVDGVAYAPHRRVDVAALGIDFYAQSLYKTYGPHVGLLWGRRELLLRARGQYYFFIDEDDVPYKLEPGNPCYELSAALVALPAYFDALAGHHGVDDAWHLVAEHEECLATRLLDFLATQSKLRVLGPAAGDARRRVPTISFVVEGRTSSTIPPRLDGERIAVRWGHFHSYRLIRELGLLEQDGVVRVSMVHYNSLEEVDRLVSVLDQVIS